MNVFNFIINFKENVNLNDKLSTLVESFSSAGFENQITTPTFALFAKDKIHTITLTQKQYNYQINSEFSASLFPEIANNISSTIDCISEWTIDDATYTIRLVSFKDCVNAFKKTKNLDNISSDDTVIGLGYRYFINVFDKLSEFKAEPLVRDENKLFFEGIYNFTAETDIMNLLQLINSDFEKRIKIFEERV